MGNIVLRRANPFGWFDDFDALDRVWGHIGGGVASPRIDIVEEKDAYRIIADLPGLSEKDVDVHVEDRTLIISAKVETSKQDDKADYVVRERSVGKLSRQIQLSDAIDTDKLSAEFAKGQLTITAPKLTEKRQKQIAIKAA